MEPQDLRLNSAALRGLLPSVRRRATTRLDEVAAHLDEHRGYVSWSGGKDSTAVLSLARQADPNVPVCWFDSGLEFPENRAYIAELADRWNLNLHIIAADSDALTVMAATGTWDHTAETDYTAPDLHDTLITQPAQQARVRFGHGELWGLRAAESAARRRLLAPGQGRFTRADGTRVYSPIWDWRDTDVTGHLAAAGIPENPVYTKLRALGATDRDLRVGLMLDGSGLDTGRATYLRRGWPEEWQRMITSLPRLAEWR